MSVEVLVFDWDGTLVDSEAHIVDSITQAAQAMKLEPLSYDRKKSIIGLGMREALNVLYPGLSEKDIDTMRQHYSGYFFKRGTSEHDLFPNVVDTLSQLKAQGYRLAVATGKSRNGLSKALVSTGLNVYFEIERCADETASKPHPLMLQQIAEHFAVAPERMLMVGDTSYDLEMAAAFGMPSVGVSYGVHDVSLLRQYKPVAIIDCISQLHAYL